MKLNILCCKILIFILNFGLCRTFLETKKMTITQNPYKHNIKLFYFHWQCIETNRNPIH